MAQAVILLVIIATMVLSGFVSFFFFSPHREIVRWMNRLKKERKKQQKKSKEPLSQYRFSVNTIDGEITGIATFPEGGSFREVYRVSEHGHLYTKFLVGFMFTLPGILYLLLQPFLANG
jgi:hypothetical protein